MNLTLGTETPLGVVGGILLGDRKYWVVKDGHGRWASEAEVEEAIAEEAR